jgi:hypothetical protein
MKTHIQKLFLILALFTGVTSLQAQGTTAFTYQGQLRDGGTNANGAYTMTFKLYDTANGGVQIGGTVTTSPMLANGLFTVNLDFGNVFNGSARWLDISAQSGTNASETLTPRVQVLPTPYAQFAAVAATVTNGAIKNAQLAGNAINTTNIQNGAITMMQLAVGAVSNANLTANAVAATNIQSNAITSTQIANGAVTDAKIVSVSGAKISGSVALASNAYYADIAAALHTYVTTAGGTNDGTTFWDVYAALAAGSGIIPKDFVIAANGVAQMVIRPGQGVGVLTAFSANGDANFHGQLNVTPQNASYPAAIINGETDIFGKLNVQNFGIFADGNIFSNGNIRGSDVEASGNMWATSFNQWSDRNFKEKFIPIDNQAVLKRVITLPISRWNYKTDETTQHIGPMAQDFYAAFNVGPDDKHIATVDEGGVALAAIQGLNQKLEQQGKDKDAEIQTLKQQNDSFAKRLHELEAAVRSLAEKK